MCLHYSLQSHLINLSVSLLVTLRPTLWGKAGLVNMILLPATRERLIITRTPNIGVISLLVCNLPKHWWPVGSKWWWWLWWWRGYISPQSFLDRRTSHIWRDDLAAGRDIKPTYSQHISPFTAPLLTWRLRSAGWEEGRSGWRMHRSSYLGRCGEYSSVQAPTCDSGATLA